MKLFLSLFLIFFSLTSVQAQKWSKTPEKRDKVNTSYSKNSNIYYGVSSSDLTTLLKRTPLDFIVERDEWNDPKILIKMGDRKVALWTHECKKQRCEDLRLTTYWKIGGKGPNLKKINEWNSQNRWTKAFMDKDNDAVLESDLDVRDGVSDFTLLNFIEIFSNHVQKFEKFMNY